MISSSSADKSLDNSRTAFLGKIFLTSRFESTKDDEENAGTVAYTGYAAVGYLDTKRAEYVSTKIEVRAGPVQVIEASDDNNIIIPTKNKLPDTVYDIDTTFKNMVKIFINPFEMSVENGPTFFLHKKYTRLKHFRTFPQPIPDKELELFAPQYKNELKSTIGKPGKAFIVDVAKCLHQGGRCVLPRALLLISANTQSSISS